MQLIKIVLVWKSPSSSVWRQDLTGRSWTLYNIENNAEELCLKMCYDLHYRVDVLPHFLTVSCKLMSWLNWGWVLQLDAKGVWECVCYLVKLSALGLKTSISDSKEGTTRLHILRVWSVLSETV
jgi:hypothetical protein